ncbi:hypothetical protein GCM10010493_47870 [Streptomyces lavendulae subsp. grasserius]
MIRSRPGSVVAAARSRSTPSAQAVLRPGGPDAPDGAGAPASGPEAALPGAAARVVMATLTSPSVLCSGAVWP